MQFVHDWGLPVLAVILGIVVQGCALRGTRPSRRVVRNNWDSPTNWYVTANEGTAGDVISATSSEGPVLQVTYTLAGDHGFVQLKKTVEGRPADDIPVTFLIKAAAKGDLEVKFVDGDGSVYGAKVPLKDRFVDWTRVTAYRKDMNYLWGGDRKYSGLSEFHLAFSGRGAGTVLLSDVGFGTTDLQTSFTADPKAARDHGPFYVEHTGPQFDPDCDQPGIGFAQRRAAAMTPEDPRVLEWLKTLQDVSSPGRQLLPTTENNECHTFNNALVASAFILKGEKERAERILDFFAAATDRNNTDPTLQNFFYRGEARGFFQEVALNPAGNVAAFHVNPSRSYGQDRWMGDMAWLLFAYKHYEQTYGPGRYREITGLLRDLLVSWFKDADDVPGGGYVQHGWRKSDAKLHEDHGHPEGNIDGYAFFKLLGEEEYARKVRTWLDAKLRGDSDPLDLYTWRVLAYDGERAEVLEIPDCDLRYRKTVTVNGQLVTGPFGYAEPAVTNIWMDGLGHIACAFQSGGNLERGWFYANQFDPMLMKSALGGKDTRTLPYSATRQGGFDFDQSKGYISVAAWYLFAKNGFNPMRLTTSSP